MRIDVHSHFLPIPYIDRLRAAAGPFYPGTGNDETTLLKLLELQDAVGIDVQVLSTGTHFACIRDPATAVDAARCCNDLYADVVSRHGGRFAAFANLPLPHGAAAAGEAVRCLDELGFAGVGMGCSALGHTLDEPAFDDLWNELNARDGVVFVHPGGVAAGTEPAMAGMDDLAISLTISGAAEIATAAVRLAAHLRHFPRVRVIIAILGGSLPFLLNRVALRAPYSTLFAEGGAQSLIENLKRFHFDIDLLPDPIVLDVARRVFGLEQFVFGSDSPTGSPEIARQFLRDGGFTAEEEAAVMSTNPAAIFGNRLKIHA